jgi:hypothetical protein
MKKLLPVVRDWHYLAISHHRKSDAARASDSGEGRWTINPAYR